MDKLRIDQFKGLYTNANEASLNPEYQREAFNVRFKAGSMESEGYTRPLPIDIANVVYTLPVRLDEDRLGTKLVGNDLVPDYTQNYTYYVLYATFDEGPNGKIYLGDSSGSHYVDDVDGRVIKVVESDGIIKALTENGTLYWLGRINRHFKGAKIPIEKDFYLVKVPDLTQYIDFFVEAIDTPVKIDKDVQFFYYKRIEEDIYIESRFKENNKFYKNHGIMIVYKSVAGLEYLKIKYGTIHDIGNIYTPKNKSWEDISFVVNSGQYFVYLSVFLTETFVTEIEQNPVDTGLSKDYYDLLVTATYDNSNEYVIYTSLGNKRESSAKYFLETNFIYKPDFNFRITAISIYLRHDEKDDFQQVRFLSLTTGPVDDEFKYLIDDLSGNGIFLTQTIGAYYDKKTYKPITSFTDYVEINGVAYSINQSRVYFCSVGKGNIMKEIFYDYIPETEGEFLVDANGSLGVFSGQLDLIAVQDSGEGFLLFSFKDSLNFTIRDQYDLATSPEGIIIHTNKGIYVTNGYERLLISEQINDIIENNYDTGNIFYDDTNDVLFYLCENGSWRYDFAYPQWAQFIIKDGENYDHIRGILSFGYNGEMYQNVNSKVYQLQKTNDVTSIIQTPRVDLDFPNIAKIVTYFIFDFEGRLILSVEDQLNGQIKYDITHSVRKSAMIGVPVGMRVPSATLGSAFTFSGKIFAIEIHYDILGEFRDEDFIPSPEAYFQGPSQLTELLESIKQKAKAGS